MINLNKEVTQFLDNLNHPLRKEIEELRQIVLNSENELTENIKWNGPNYCFINTDKITMIIPDQCEPHIPIQCEPLFRTKVNHLLK
jgi:uncharacterized protein YdhG (YjbR/CyaY superfamily)